MLYNLWSDSWLAWATELCRQLHWLPVRQCISYKVTRLVITYKTRSTSKPAYLSDLLQDYRPARTLRSSDKLLLSVLRMALAFLAKAFSVSAASVWNSLSYQCRSAELFNSFRRILKTELFDIASSERKVCLVFAGMRVWFACDAWRYTNLFWLIDWANGAAAHYVAIRCPR